MHEGRELTHVKTSQFVLSKSLHNPQVRTNSQWQTEPRTSFNYFREDTRLSLNDSKLLLASKTSLSSAVIKISTILCSRGLTDIKAG